MQATTSVPIVVGAAADLLALGGVQSLAHPGGNVTGVTHAQPELDRKRLELLKETVPSVTRITYLFETDAVPATALQALDDSGRLVGVRLQRISVREPGQIEAAVVSMVKEGAQAVLVQDAMLLSRHAERVTALALKHRLPTMSQIPSFAERGGLLQYGADVFELFRRSANHVDRILKGARPGDLPIEQPTKVDLIVNLRIAKALGLTIPPSVLVRADHTIR
jgi:putative ABC transport system substrate-binding protein